MFLSGIESFGQNCVNTSIFLQKEISSNLSDDPNALEILFPTVHEK